jgi:hypothetical protein
MTEMKLQIPSSNIQRNTKFKSPDQPTRDKPLELGAWSFSGAWLLVLGASFTAMLTSCATGQTSNEFGFRVQHQTDRLVITHGTNPVAHFVFADTNILRPYFAHVHTPDGIQVTRNHPPMPGVDPVDHPTMHPGLWLAFGNISGHDFWRNKATIRHERFSEPPKAATNYLTFSTMSSLVATNGSLLATMLSHFAINPYTDGYLFRWRAYFTPLTNTVVFGDQEEMGFGIRIATPLSEKNGGTLKNSEGLIGAKNAWGKTAAWCDYSGILSNRLVGITVMPHPTNFRPSWFHSRDYGLIVANPFGQQVFTKSETPSNKSIISGGALELYFAAFVHSTPTNKPPDIAGVFEAFSYRSHK